MAEGFRKRVKLSAKDEPSTSLHIQTSFSEEKKEEVRRAIKELSFNRDWSFNMIKFTYCNANTNSTFSDASSALNRSTDPGVQNRFHLYPFADIFFTGCYVLTSYLNDATIPEDKAQCIALQRLLSVVNNIEEVCLQLEGVPKDDETAFTLSLLHHLMKELAVNQDYVIDSQSKCKPKTCPCGCEEKITGSYGDTSIGHVDTWHGAVDALLCNQSIALGIYPVERQTSDEDEENESSDDDEDQLCEVEEAKFKRFTNQLIAETIVFAFLQKRRCPEFKTFLIPTIGVSRKQLIFFFYDPQTDIFLETDFRHLFYKDEPKMMQMPVVLALWLTINYKYFSSGISHPMLDRDFNSLFLSHLSEEKKELFNEGLQLGSCRGHVKKQSIRRRDPIWILVQGEPADSSLIKIDRR